MTDLRPLLGELGLNQGVEFLLGRDVKDVSGWCGDYTIEVEGGGGVRRVQVGGILVAVADDPEWVRTLAPKLHVKLDDRGDFLRRNDTTMAVRTDDDGIFAVCRAEDGASARAEIADASNAIVILDGILSQNEISHPMRMSEVDRELCGACGTCVKTCAFHACRIDATDRVSVIDERRCKACGNCVTACPTGARDLVTYPNAYIAEAIKICAQFQANGAPKALCFLCNGCGYPAADAAGLGGHSYPVSILPLRVACGGRVDTQHILEAYRYGFDGVMVTVCREGHCHNIVGNVDMNRRLNLFRAVLTSRELDPERLRIVEIAPYEGARFAQEATRFVKDLAAMAKTGA
jgi:coenzyme F420-reducing hydrogenase delta subunit/Pyruvate/2-oxoacid:ferredoxin oxidoreductase delta subunit